MWRTTHQVPYSSGYTVDDLRVILNVSRSTVYQLLKRNEFRWFQIGGGKYRISKKSFDDWLDCQS